MKAGIEALSVAAGESFERDFMGEGEVVVRREGHSRARHLFIANGRTIGRLRWRGLRRAVYETEGTHSDIRLAALHRCISIVAEDGSESFLRERARANPHREELRIEMAEGDNFCLTRSVDSRFRSEVAFKVHKEFYNSPLLVFRFDMRHRTQTTVRIEVLPAMKWESRFVHRLLALVVCRIILERRHSGSQPLRVKEKPLHFAASKRVRERRLARSY
ncbi:MAG TPA: hypothetical protein VJH03_02225 [Blastocatellia bacterium]|nr:hypothetical protein [Blastocatellia bacterium]